jgi:hypothetical protein
MAGLPEALPSPGRVDGVVDRVVDRPVDTLAGSDAGMIMVRGAAVRVLDRRGHVVRTLGSAQASPAPWLMRIPRSAHVLDTPSWPGLGVDSDWSGIYDEDDIDDSDDPRLADETEPGAWDLGGTDRRMLRATAPVEMDHRKILSVAADASQGWMGGLDGLTRVDLQSGRETHVWRSRGGGVSAVAVSPDGAYAAIVDGRELLRSRDAGKTFQPIEGIAFGPPAPRLAVMSSGTVLIVDTCQLRMVPPDGDQVETPGVDQAADVVACGSQAMVLAGGAVHAVSGTPPVRIARVGAAPIGAERITCAADGRTWIAWGAHLWTSADRGLTWTARNDLPPTGIKGVAITASSIWIATARALVPLPMTPPLDSSLDEKADLGAKDSGAAPSKSSLGTGHPSPRLRPWWWAALPRLDITFDAVETHTRRELRGLAFLTFVLDGPSTVWAREARFRTEMTHRRLRAATTAHQIASPAPDSAPGDPIAVEERRARTQILEDSR